MSQFTSVALTVISILAMLGLTTSTVSPSIRHALPHSNIASHLIRQSIPISPADPKPATWQLTFNSEFNSERINPYQWDVISGRWRWNNELETYSSRALKLNNGLNIISSDVDGKYVSGALNTQRTFAFTYGKVFVRAKLPTGKGVFPAIWMRPYPTGVYPEIDIMENIGSQPDVVWQVFHYKKPGGALGDLYTSDTLSPGRYHNFELDWSPRSLVWKIDGHTVFSVRNQYVPRTPMYLFLNTAIGGNWPGAPSSSVFPQTFYIQYVRVYQKVVTIPLQPLGDALCTQSGLCASSTGDSH